jgi:hypothetical protein
MVPIIDILEDIRAEFKTAAVTLSNSFEEEDIHHGDIYTDGWEHWRTFDPLKSLGTSFVGSNDDTIATLTHHSDPTLDDMRPRGPKFSDRDITPKPPGHKHSTNTKRRTTKTQQKPDWVWFCSESGDGPVGD